MTQVQFIQPITDDRGRLLVIDRPEPEPASVLLVDGLQGNAWQRYYSDGLWHRGKAKRTWLSLTRERNVLLVHDAPVRTMLGCRACEISGVVCHNHIAAVDTNQTIRGSAV